MKARKKIRLFSNISSVKKRKSILNQWLPNHPKMRMMYFCCAFFLIGIAGGAVLIAINSGELVEYVATLTKTGLTMRVTAGLLPTVINCLVPHLMILLLCWLLSNCTVGAPGIIVLILYKGIGVGLMGGYIYRAYGGMALLYNLVLIMPPALIAALGLLWMAVYAIKASVTLHALAAKGAANHFKENSGAVFHSMAIAAVLALASALLEAVLFKLMGGFFV